MQVKTFNSSLFIFLAVFLVGCSQNETILEPEKTTPDISYRSLCSFSGPADFSSGLISELNSHYSCEFAGHQAGCTIIDDQTVSTKTQNDAYPYTTFDNSMTTSQIQTTINEIDAIIASNKPSSNHKLYDLEITETVRPLCCLPPSPSNSCCDRSLDLKISYFQLSCGSES